MTSEIPVDTIIGHPVWPRPDLPPADPELIAEQERVGKIMDALDKHERFVAARRDMMLKDDSLMLYRLPLTIDQTDRVYSAILADRAAGALAPEEKSIAAEI